MADRLGPASRAAARVAIVTGAGSGLGATFAEHLVAAGAAVHLADVDGDGVRATAERLGSTATAHVVDLTDDGAVAAMVADVVRRDGRIDALVNNAGGEVPVGGDDLPPSHPPIEDVDLEQWQRVFDINLRTTLLCCRHVVPTMKAQRAGRIVNIASGAARGTSHGGVSRAYSCAKAGVVTMTRHLARELGAAGEITVNCVLPGMILSKPLLRRAWERMSDEQREAMLAASALGRLVEPDEIARVVLFLCSDDSSPITGQSLSVNAGAYMA